MKELNEILDKIREDQKEKGHYFNNNNKTVKNKSLKKRKPSRKPLRKNNNKKPNKTNKKTIQSHGNNRSRKSLSYSSVLFSPKPIKKTRPNWKPPGNAKKIRLG